MSEYAVYDTRTKRWITGFFRGVLSWQKKPGDTFGTEREANIARNKARIAFFGADDPKAKQIVSKEVE